MEPPSFSTTGPQLVRAAPGSDASLVLPLPSGSPPFQFEWSRAGAKLDDRFKRSEDAGGVRLTITAAQTDDSAVYTLQASNAAGKDTTRVRLEISPDEMPTGEDPPTFLRRLQDLTVKVGTRTRFLVEIVSSTECRVTWYRNERRLLEAERIALVRDGNFWCADISAVSVDDAGRWTCTAENVGGRASCSAHLNVLVPKAYKRPEFVEELRALLTEQGTVSLECKVVGVPTPVLRWFKDSREIKAGDVFALTANAEDPTSLGTYTCEAVNCMGRAYSSSKVHVVGRASREGSSRPSSGGITPEPPPIFTKELEDQFVRICEPVTLSCNIVVPPWPRSVIWYNKEGKVEASDKYRVLEDGVGGYLLEVQTAEWPDEGEWKCVATSTGGRVGISTCYVSMDVPKNYRKPRFMENLQAVLTEEGLVSFECKVVGFPTPVLSWFKDGQELKPGDVYQLTGTNSLGSYCCIARNCMGQASSSAELTVEDIQNQLNEEEKLQLFSKNQAPKFLQGLKSVEAKIDEPFRFTIKVSIPPDPTVLWYRDDQPVDESSRCHLVKEDRGVFVLDILNLEFMDQAEWKCVAMNDFGHSVTSCFLKLIIPRHYKKPRFLENLQAILSDEGAVNLECKVIGVPQPVLKWYKDGEELKPGDIHRIISGQDGTCCLGTYTCEAQNCMGIAASSASLLGFEDSMKAKNKKKSEEQVLQRNLSLSTIHEERTSQMYDTPVGDITLDEKGEISFSFDGKEVSVSLYETPDLTEEEALQIVEMYADQLSENVTEHNVVELPPLRFVKETSTSGNLLMEAIIIDVSPEYFTSPEEDLRTEADVEDISIADENGAPQLSLDQEVDGEDYLEKTIALISDEKADIPKRIYRKKSDSQKSAEDYFSLSREQSLSEEKKDDDTQILSESDLQSFASARSSGKPKSKSSKPSIDDGQESSDVTKTVLLKDDYQNIPLESDLSLTKNKLQRRSSRDSRRSSSGSEKSLNKAKGLIQTETESENILNKIDTINKENVKNVMNTISSSLTEIINETQIIERDIILKSELMSTAATASNSLEIINSLITPLTELHSIIDAIKETVTESSESIISLINKLPQSLKNLQESLTIINKCIDVESENKTLVKKTSISLMKKCGNQINYVVDEINRSMYDKSIFAVYSSDIETVISELITVINRSMDMVNCEENRELENNVNIGELTLESKHLRDTQKAIYELRASLKSLLFIVEAEDISEVETFAGVKKSEILLNDMSTPIQDLQTALEQIEILSVTESESNLLKYNTEIIERAMESVLKLRTSFEKLSAEATNIKNKNTLNLILNTININIKDISIYLDELELKTGKFEILSSDNKLEALQKMAQILINLENNLHLLEIVPDVKTHLAEFHKNLTKVLENVIESNDEIKYFTLLEICDAVKRINTSIKSLDSNSTLTLASVSKTLKIIKTIIVNNIFHPELNHSILLNIDNTLVSMQETINNAEEIKLNSSFEEVSDLSLEKYEETKVNIVLENIEHTIISISNVISHETTKDLSLKKVLENICPLLVDLKYYIASLNINAFENQEKLSDIESSSFTLLKTMANPLVELQQNISVLSQVICENVDSQEVNQLMVDYAKPLLELRNTLEILQQDVISQYIENRTQSDISSSIANVVENLQSCILLIQEQPIIEVADDMSTLEDVSCIKTTADILPCDDFITANMEEMVNVQFLHPDQKQQFNSRQVLQKLYDQITILKNPELLNILDTTEVPKYSSIKPIIIVLDNIHKQIESVLQPMATEVYPVFESFSRIEEIVLSLKEIHEQLSVIDISGIPVCESVTNLYSENFLQETLLDFKGTLNECLNVLHCPIESTGTTTDISNKVNSLKQMCEKLNIAYTELDITPEEKINEDITQLNKTMEKIVEIRTTYESSVEIKHAIENLYETVINLQQEAIQIVNKNPELLSKQAIFAQIVNDFEKNIMALEEIQLVDVSHLRTIKENVLEVKRSISAFKECVNIEDILRTYLNQLKEPINFIYNAMFSLNQKTLLSSKENKQEIINNEIALTEWESIKIQLENVNKDIDELKQNLNNKNIDIISSDVSMATQIDQKIHYILNFLNSMQEIKRSDTMKYICGQIESIENMLHCILSSEKVVDNESKFHKKQTETLLQHMEQYIEVLEIVEEVSAVIKLEDLKESANIVQELRESIAATEPISEEIAKDLIIKVKEEQSEIAQRLQKALTSLQTQALASSQELTTTINENVRQQIIEVVSELQNDLVALTGQSVIREENVTIVPSPITQVRLEENIESVSEETNKLLETDTFQLIEPEYEIVSETNEQIEQLQTDNQINLIPIELAISSSQADVTTEINTEESWKQSENNKTEDLIAQNLQISKQPDNNVIKDSPPITIIELKDVTLDKHTINDILKENLKDYISENTIAIMTKQSNPLHSEHLEKTIQIAQELWDEVENENISPEMTEFSNFTAKQIELVLSLNEAIFIMSETTLEESQELENKVEKDEMYTFKNVVSNLRNALETIIEVLDTSPSFNQVEESQKQENIVENIEEKNLSAVSENTSGSDELKRITVSDEMKYNIAAENVEVLESLDKRNILKSEHLDDVKLIISTTDSLATAKDIGSTSIFHEEDVVRRNPVIEDTLKQHLSNYICEDIQNVFRKLLPLLNSEVANHSIQLAQQLYNLHPSEESQSLDFSKNQLKLALLLEKTITSLSEITFQEPQFLQMLNEEKELLKINDAIKNLNISLHRQIQNALMQADVEILDLNEVKVLISQAPFKYEIIVDEYISDLKLSQAETTLGNLLICTKDVKVAVSSEIEKMNTSTNNIILPLEPQKLLTETYIENLKDTSLITKENVEVLTYSKDTKAVCKSKTSDFKQETDSIQKLDNLLKEVNNMIDSSFDNKMEAMQNTLDEAQTLIIKLKSDFDGTVSYTINETLEDLECNIRSVQLQINEHCPPLILKEACANLQILVAEISEKCYVAEVLKHGKQKSTQNILSECANDVEHTIELIGNVTCPENAHQLNNIISKLNQLKNTIKSLKSNYLSDTEILIMGGVEFIQTLNQVEENIFSLEKDLETENNIDPIIRDSILSAVHSVYESISNMRGTVFSVQKRYMNENYGEPSRNFLKSIKNVTILSKYAKSNWEQFAKSLRKVLNHFEDVKFYINFDKTARLPSDAAFTKIILSELYSVLSANVSDLDTAENIKVCDSLDYINKILKDIEQRTTLEVKEKIPIFKELSINMFELTNFILKCFDEVQSNLAETEPITTLQEEISFKKSEKEIDSTPQKSDDIKETNVELKDNSTGVTKEELLKDEKEIYEKEFEIVEYTKTENATINIEQEKENHEEHVKSCLNIKLEENIENLKAQNNETIKSIANANIQKENDEVKEIIDENKLVINIQEEEQAIATELTKIEGTSKMDGNKGDLKLEVKIVEDVTDKSKSQVDYNTLDKQQDQTENLVINEQDKNYELKHTTFDYIDIKQENEKDTSLDDNSSKFVNNETQEKQLTLKGTEITNLANEILQPTLNNTVTNLEKPEENKPDEINKFVDTFISSEAKIDTIKSIEGEVIAENIIIEEGQKNEVNKGKVVSDKITEKHKISQIEAIEDIKESCIIAQHSQDIDHTSLKQHENKNAQEKEINISKDNSSEFVNNEIRENQSVLKETGITNLANEILQPTLNDAVKNLEKPEEHKPDETNKFVDTFIPSEAKVNTIKGIEGEVIAENIIIEEDQKNEVNKGKVVSDKITEKHKISQIEAVEDIKESCIIAQHSQDIDHTSLKQHENKNAQEKEINISEDNSSEFVNNEIRENQSVLKETEITNLANEILQPTLNDAVKNFEKPEENKPDETNKFVDTFIPSEAKVNTIKGIEGEVIAENIIIEEGQKNEVNKGKVVSDKITEKHKICQIEAIEDIKESCIIAQHSQDIDHTSLKQHENKNAQEKEINISKDNSSEFVNNEIRENQSVLKETEITNLANEILQPTLNDTVKNLEKPEEHKPDETNKFVDTFIPSEAKVNTIKGIEGEVIAENIIIEEDQKNEVNKGKVVSDKITEKHKISQIEAVEDIKESCIIAQHSQDIDHTSLKQHENKNAQEKEINISEDNSSEFVNNEIRENQSVLKETEITNLANEILQPTLNDAVKNFEKPEENKPDETNKFVDTFIPSEAKVNTIKGIEGEVIAENIIIEEGQKNEVNKGKVVSDKITEKHKICQIEAIEDIKESCIIAQHSQDIDHTSLKQHENKNAQEKEINISKDNSSEFVNNEIRENQSVLKETEITNLANEILQPTLNDTVKNLEKPEEHKPDETNKFVDTFIPSEAKVNTIKGIEGEVIAENIIIEEDQKNEVNKGKVVSDKITEKHKICQIEAIEDIKESCIIAQHSQDIDHTSLKQHENKNAQEKEINISEDNSSEFVNNEIRENQSVLKETEITNLANEILQPTLNDAVKNLEKREENKPVETNKFVDTFIPSEAKVNTIKGIEGEVIAENIIIEEDQKNEVNKGKVVSDKITEKHKISQIEAIEDIKESCIIAQHSQDIDHTSLKQHENKNAQEKEINVSKEQFTKTEIVEQLSEQLCRDNNNDNVKKILEAQIEAEVKEYNVYDKIKTNQQEKVNILNEKDLKEIEIITEKDMVQVKKSVKQKDSTTVSLDDNACSRSVEEDVENKDTSKDSINIMKDNETVNQEELLKRDQESKNIEEYETQQGNDINKKNQLDNLASLMNKEIDSKEIKIEVSKIDQPCNVPKVPLEKKQQNETNQSNIEDLGVKILKEKDQGIVLDNNNKQANLKRTEQIQEDDRKQDTQVSKENLKQIKIESKIKKQESNILDKEISQNNKEEQDLVTLKVSNGKGEKLKESIKLETIANVSEMDQETVPLYVGTEVKSNADLKIEEETLINIQNHQINVVENFLHSAKIDEVYIDKNRNEARISEEEVDKNLVIKNEEDIINDQNLEKIVYKTDAKQKTLQITDEIGEVSENSQKSLDIQNKQIMDIADKSPDSLFNLSELKQDNKDIKNDTENLINKQISTKIQTEKHETDLINKSQEKDETTKQQEKSQSKEILEQKAQNILLKDTEELGTNLTEQTNNNKELKDDLEKQKKNKLSEIIKISEEYVEPAEKEINKDLGDSDNNIQQVEKQNQDDEQKQMEKYENKRRDSFIIKQQSDDLHITSDEEIKVNKLNKFEADKQQDYLKTGEQEKTEIVVRQELDLNKKEEIIESGNNQDKEKKRKKSSRRTSKTKDVDVKKVVKTQKSDDNNLIDENKNRLRENEAVSKQNMDDRDGSQFTLYTRVERPKEDIMHYTESEHENILKDETKDYNTELESKKYREINSEENNDKMYKKPDLQDNENEYENNKDILNKKNILTTNDTNIKDTHIEKQITYDEKNTITEKKRHKNVPAQKDEITKSENFQNNLSLEQIQGKENKEDSKTFNKIDDKLQINNQRKDQPIIKDNSLTDYELEFSKPPGYIAKEYLVEDTVPQIQISNKNSPIYKAQTLLYESQLRSSLSPYTDQRSDTTEGLSHVKDRTKALSECKSTLSEKRTSVARDIKRKPVFSTFLTDRTAVESSRVKLTCSILSPTNPTITWYKNGTVIDNKHKFKTKFVEGLITLEILNAVPSDSGEYNCTITNENGSITSSANLKVYPSFEASPIPPTFTRSIRDNYHLAENELVLECRIRGQPLPTITWLKENKPIVLSERYQAHYLADGVCRLTINSPVPEDSGKYTCKAENSVWSDQISHDVYFTGKESRLSPNIATIEKMHFSRHSLESRRPHFTNVLSDHKVVSGGTIGLQVEIRGAPIRVEWLREGHSITDLYRNAQTYVDRGIYTLALSDVTEKESGLYTCRAYSNQGNVDMNASITVVQPNQYDGKPASIVSRPEKDVLISVGEDLNISFRVQGEPKAKVFLMKGIRDITNSQRVCKMTSDDYVKFTLKRTVVSDAGTYCIFARNAYGCDRAFVTVVIRQRASSNSLISDWTYPIDDLAISSIDRNYKSVPDRIPSEPSAVDGGNNWVSLAWPKPDSQAKAPILAYKVESWLLGKEGGARWAELGITPRNSFDAFNLKQSEEYHFRITPRNRYGWGESVQTSVPIGIGLEGDRPEFIEILPGQLKVLLDETATLCCSFTGKPVPEIVWMKNGHEIEEEVNRLKIEVNNCNSSLRIDNVKTEDEGRYSCEATNIHGRSSTYARITVIADRQIWEADAKLKRERSAGVEGEYPPQFTMRLRDRRVQATYPVRLTCQIVGNPPPLVRWFKNGGEVLIDGRHTVSQDEYFHTLEIAPTTLDDGGVYEAMARNGCGAVSCRCSLVVDKGIRAYIAPEFCCGLEPLYRLSEGEELRIAAIVEAYPSVGVTWYRDGVRLRPSRRAIMTLDRDGQIELALASVTKRDAGVYTCTASNEVGSASTSGKVDIISGDHAIEKTSAPPIFISSDVPYSKEPMFIRKPRSSEAREGDTVIIECEVAGDPKPDVYWLRDFLKPDYYRDSSHFKRIGAGPAYRFEIPHAKLDYTGAYSIVAKNIHGEAKAIISLQILAKDLTSGDDTHNIRFGRVDIIPRFEKELTDLLSYDGDAIEFECHVSGNPEPSIRWFHYDEIVPECSDFESRYEEGAARLKIKQVTAEDEGTYICEASNSLGKATSSACLVVYPPGEPNTLSQRLRRPPALLSAASTPRSTPRTTPARSMSRTPGPDSRRLCSPSREIAPKFYTYPYNRVAEEGDTVVFQCAVKGLPPPWATWDKDGIIITPSARISVKEKDDMFRILEIEQVSIEDVGLYRISLENDYGRAEASARLEVITQKGKFYGTRSYSVSPRKTLTYRRRTPSFSKQD